MRYPIAIEPGDGRSAFGVVVPDLPGCFSAGDTLDEALTNASDGLDHNPGHCERRCCRDTAALVTPLQRL